MSDAILTAHPPLDSPNYSKDDFDSLPIPPLDPMFLSGQSSGENYNLVSDLEFPLDDNYDFDITFDDLEDFNFPSEDEFSKNPNCNCPDNSDSQESVLSADHNVAKYLNPSPSNSTSCNSRDQLNVPSPVSSQGSGDGGSGVSDSSTFVVDQKVKLEEERNNIIKNGSISKRKKENSIEDTSGETRNQKYRRSENANSQCVNDEDEKRKARLIRNRESAQLSRQRKKHYVEELEDKVKSMHSTITDLNSKISYFMAENASLRQQLSGNGMCPPPMYPPMAPLPYPWVPCAPYVVKQQGSQVPLVPIPRLKPQQPAPAAKSKKSEAKKAEGKTKQVASVSFLGLLFFVLLFGGLVPIVNVKFGGPGDHGANGFVNDKFYDQHSGRVLRVVGHSNGSRENVDVGFSSRDFDKGYRIQCGRGRDGCLAHDADNKRGLGHLPEPDELVGNGNNSKPLAASLYVPRNDKLVKIDGNLIIHSVLASERATSSHANPESKETGLAIRRVMSSSPAIPGRYSHLYRHLNEGQKALTSGSSDTLKDHSKSSADDRKLQQWFHEGLAGPMLSSGMCTEVFQFDVSPTPGAIIPASSVSNITAERQQNATNHSKGKNRRILRGFPIPLTGSDLNITGEHVGSSQKENFQGNKSVSPMVVSLLVDPREAGDIEVDGIITPKSVSRIFVVVLLDSVKYVTYSCVLPRSGPHLVTT